MSEILLWVFTIAGYLTIGAIVSGFLLMNDPTAIPPDAVIIMLVWPVAILWKIFELLFKLGKWIASEIKSPKNNIPKDTQ